MARDNLKEERLKILEMLKAGTIDAKEAEELLSALGHEEATATVFQPKKGPFKLLKIFVNSDDGDKINIKIPVEFAKLLKNGKFNTQFDGADIDIDAIIEMVSQGMDGELVDVEAADGTTVKIVVE